MQPNADPEGNASSELIDEMMIGQQALGTLEAPAETFAVYMAVVEAGPSLTFAAFSEEDNRIVIEECVVHTDDVRGTIERIVAAIRPTMLLFSPKIVANDSLVEILTTVPPMSGGDDADPGDPVPNPVEVTKSIPYRLMKRASFDVRTCRSLISRLRVRSLMRSSDGHPAANVNMDRRFPLKPDQQDRVFPVSNYHSLASVIDFDSIGQVQAVGALLSFLQTTVFVMGANGAGGTMTVNDVVHSNASAFMNISAETLSALQIFATEHHPLAAAKGQGNPKEGSSLFALLDRTKSRAGRQCLKSWMLKPLLDPVAIRARQDFVELFMLPEMSSPLGSVLTLLERVGAVDKILARMQKCSAKPNDFLILIKTLGAAQAILEKLQGEILWNLHQRAGPGSSLLVQGQAHGDVNNNNAMPYTFHPPGHDDNPLQASRYMAAIRNILVQCHVDVLTGLHQRLAQTVDEDCTPTSRNVVVRPGYHEGLDARKRQYECMRDWLEERALGLRKELPQLGNRAGVCFVPQVGFLISTETRLPWQEPLELPEDFAFIFSEGGESYFKNPEMRHLDESIGDLDAYIKDTEALIVAQLEDEILDAEAELRSTFSALAELDAVLALASCAIDLDYVRPEILPASEKLIQINQGRHPLQEIIVDGAFVPNSTLINETRRVNVITGPNFSGKSCYARQVGILCYMAQLGSFIPCLSASISVCDQILTKFSAVETCSVPQSSFQLDLTQMASILRRATSDSLVVIDEFGKGTSPASGIALLSGALRNFASKQCRLLCTTHFLELFSMSLLIDGQCGYTALRMSMSVPDTKDKLPWPQFVLEDGVSSSSAGLVCAKMAGVKDSIIQRAYEIIQATKDRRQVKPLLEILRGDISQSWRGVLAEFINRDWRSATDNEVDLFLSKIHDCRR